MSDKEIFCKIDGKWVPFTKLPCAKCKWRYDLHCPKCKWNRTGEYDTYGGKLMSQEEADKLNKEN